MAKIIINHVKRKYKVIVISSAMSGVTNDLVKKSKEISSNFIASEHDALISSGEQAACSLIAGTLNHFGYKSRSWISWQIPIITNDNHTSSQVLIKIEPGRAFGTGHHQTTYLAIDFLEKLINNSSFK